MKTVLARLLTCGIALTLSSAVPEPVHAQGTRADYERAERFLPWNIKKLVSEADVTPHWIAGSSRFWYEKKTADEKEFRLVDSSRNVLGPAFNHARLAEALSRAAHRAYDARHLPFDSFEFLKKETAIELTVEKQRWRCSLGPYNCARKDEGDPWATPSPDGRWAAFVRDYDLYLRNLSSGQEVRLTTDGERRRDYATPLPSLQLMIEQGTEAVRQRAAVFWSPDSGHLITYRMDSRQAGEFTSLQFVPPNQLRPKAFTYVYPLPGEVLSRAEAIIFDVPSGKRIDVQTEPLEMEFQEGPTFEWYKDSRRIHYVFRSRGYKRAEFREVDAASGRERVVVREEAGSYIDPGENDVTIADEGAKLVWLSERDGWNHIYLYDGRTGQLVTRLTKGPWTVRHIEHVDARAKLVYFLGGGREPGEDPYETHLYSVSFDGSHLQALTPERANHAVSVSPDGTWFVDNSSRVDLPAASLLRHAPNGELVRVLEKTDPSTLEKTGWRFPEPFEGKAADGETNIYGLIWRPSNFEAAKKYPVIEHLYTGPQSFFVPKTFAASRAPMQSLAELGFIVVMVDGRGTTGRSRAFHEYSYRNVGGVFDDHVALIRQMAAKYPYLDISRMGIYGTSAGGYGAAHAMLLHPEFYKVCVSISGDHDARLDKAWWNELYQGYPMGEDYVAQSNVTLASKLEGRLLLVHGDVDHNVHPVGTMRLVDALIKANKSFDMLFVPNMFHGEGSNPYLVRRRWDYFVKYLLGVEPPPDFEIAPPPKDEDMQ